MKKFEYTMREFPIDPEYVSQLNTMGQQGWQVVATHTITGGKYAYVVTFMREKSQDQKTETVIPKHSHSIEMPCMIYGNQCPMLGTKYEVKG